MSVELSERARILLRSLIDTYVEQGQPVASGSLARRSGLSVSPATVRNVMAELEDQGYIVSPHTSAGRVPTARGYRFLVDSLLASPPPETLALDLDLRAHFDPDLPARELVRSASELLSRLTRQAGVVMLPRSEEPILRHVEFLPLAGERLLVILVLDDHEVQNRIIHTREPLTREALQAAANYINTHWLGQPLPQIRQGIVAAMADDRADIDGLMRAAIAMAGQALQAPAADPDYVVSGEAHLIEQASVEHIGRLRDLFQAFQSKQDILHLLDRCIEAPGVQIFIGEESGYQVLDDYSVVTAPYSSRQSVGVLGIIGPTRMAYERVIPVVDFTARMLGAALARHAADL